MIKLFKYLKPYKKYVAGVLILTFFNALSELYLPNLMSDIVNNGIVKGDTNYILKIGGIMLIVAAFSAISIVFASLLSSKTAMGFGKDLRQKIFSHVEGFSLNEFDKIGTSSLITRTTNDITQVQQVMVMMLRMMVRAPMMCIGGIIMAVSKNRQLSMIIVFVIPILILAISIVAKKGFPLFKLIQEKIDRVNLVLREELTGIRVIRAFDRIDHEKKRFNESNKDLTDTAIKVGRIMAILMPLMNIVLNFTTIAVVWYGSKQIDMGTMQVGDLMAFIQYVMQIMFSLIMVSMMFIMIPRASASATRVNEVLEIIPEINDKEKTKEASEKRGFIEFKDVTFSYPGAEKPALSNISFSAGPGETTAIIGGTGSGKTSLISLIPRFYDIDSGSILVNNTDIREISQKTLRAKIGFVPQKAVLFTGTISENIRYGKEDATDEEVKHAAEVAQATEFISNMKDGFDSYIAQGGTNVSGGQKQRLSIARALVRKPEIYIFDDSFSALDFKTDAKLREALKDETISSTVIIVAQRVSTVMDADRIIVLDEGKIVGIGKHEDLLNTCEVYSEIVSSQLSEEEIA
ncbi:ABC transporter ATP-binding protein/permease [Tissierella sp. MSJ-40]|uniref:ABC transporter ATP-binding protein/permease n=1 Tax=Tissierella simiarum TaxID=2841534 RepID=A0ABS6E7S4_9FIRM|nr:ABC transporter ATP-binding protein [Tissierella simiarum]MBU5438896.1 ABC transporter ATP-binding protein/permease [Tissierella simiarum]